MCAIPVITLCLVQAQFRHLQHTICCTIIVCRFADQELMQRNKTQGESGPVSSSSEASADSAASSEPTKVYASEAVLYNRTYFTPVLVSYVGGLLMAFAANSITHLGQPALLYLVPCTLTSLLVMGLVRDEIGRLWNFTDVPSFGLPEKPKN